MIVTFNYADWQALYPQFALTVTSEAQAQEYFYQAQLYCNNTDCAIIPYDTTCTPPIYTRAIILNLLVAHIAQLVVGSSLTGNQPSAIVGRVSQATEGSVSVAAELDTPQSAAWFTQTQWGLMAWQAMAPFRTAVYRPSPGRFAQIPGNGYPFGVGGAGGFRGPGW